MLFLNQYLTQWVIVIGAIFFFIIPFVINRKIKKPEGSSLPEDCHACTISTCLVKQNSDEDNNSTANIKQQLREEIAKCEVENEKN